MAWETSRGLLTDRQEEVLQVLLDFLKREERLPAARDLAGPLATHEKTVYQHILALERKECIIRHKGYIRFDSAFRREWPPLATGDVHQAMGVILVAEHVSTHFRVSPARLFAPRCMFPCHVPEPEYGPGIATSLEQPGGTTAYMAHNPGLYRFTQEELAAFAAKCKGEAKPLEPTPVYGAKCTSLLSMPIFVEGQVAGLIKVENKCGGPFTQADEEMLGHIIATTTPVFEQALSWVKQHYPNPQVQEVPSFYVS